MTIVINKSAKRSITTQTIFELTDDDVKSLVHAAIYNVVDTSVDEHADRMDPEAVTISNITLGLNDMLIGNINAYIQNTLSELTIEMHKALDGMDIKVRATGFETGDYDGGEIQFEDIMVDVNISDKTT